KPFPCDGVQRLYQSEGTIKSPGFSEGQNYQTELTCKWIIIVPMGSYVSLTFKDFALEKSKTCEHYDNVTIVERCTGTSGISGTLGGRAVGYCGTFIPPMINSTCKELHITFYSDDSDTASGFRAKYKIYKDSDSRMITCFGDKDCNKQLTHTATESFTFHCRVQGEPRPRRSFARVDGKSLPADAIDDNNGTLTIPRLRYPDDTGEYVCVANNKYGQDFATATLEVIPKCHCPPNITTNWFHSPPFVIKEKDNDHPKGIFPLLIDKMIDKCCGNCSKGHGISHVRYGTPKESLNEVKYTISSKQVVHLSFPIAGKETDEEYKGEYYRPLFSSPGVAVLVMKEDPSKSARAILNSVLSTWPVLLLTLVMAWLAGIAMWALDTWNNPDEFPRAFHRGVLEGFWWAFVTMTTVGYGDRSPKGYISRAFAIVWILVGLVVISITTGVITTSLTAITLSTNLKLYGAKIGAMENSTEYRIGVKKNSKVFEFIEFGAMFRALEDRTLAGILLDSFVAGAYRGQISSHVRVNKIISYDSSYGIVFRDAMSSRELQTCFNNYVSGKKSEISTIVKDNTSPVKEPKKSASEEVTAGLFDTKTQLYKNVLFSCIGMLAFISACGLIWDYGYRRHFRKNSTEFDELAILAGPGYETVKANMELLDTLMQEVQDFNDVWTEKLDEIMKKHDVEYNRFSQQHARP
ncbi:Potassium voltage-gated channel subfamily F member 1, partial [Paramuricea clavata]